MSYPLLITACGILVSLFTTLLATDFRPARTIEQIESTLKNQLIVSTVVMTPVRLFLSTLAAGNDGRSYLTCHAESSCLWP